MANFPAADLFLTGYVMQWKLYATEHKRDVAIDTWFPGLHDCMTLNGLNGQINDSSNTIFTNFEI